MPKIGYARVSSTSQDLEIQKAKLKAAGCEIVRAETGSGASRDGRTELATVLEFLRAGDELVVHRCDLDAGKSYKTTTFNFAVHRQPDQYRRIVDQKGAVDPA